MEIVKNIRSISANLLADYILQVYGPMSHLKLQKLIYYSEGYHLAYFDKSLIQEDFEAWVHGPVCREVYNELKGESVLYSDVRFKGNYDPKKRIAECLNTSQRELLSDVLGELSKWTSMELENATHEELPWREARRGLSPADRCEKKILKETMKSYYKSELNGKN